MIGCLPLDSKCLRVGVARYVGTQGRRVRKAQERYDLPARYSLIVSIRTPQTEVDLYTPIAQQVAQQVGTVVSVQV